MAEVLGIEIDGPKDYQKEVKKVLVDQIASNLVGMVILAGIKATGKDLTIVPYNKGEEANYGRCNSTTTMDNPLAAAPKGVKGGQKGAPLFAGKPDNPRTPDDDERYDQRYGKSGTGKGSNIRIYYSVGELDGSDCYGGVYGSLPDEKLVHELVHALRGMQGRFNPYPTEDSVRRYDTEEEFLAVVATNVYISAKNSTQLRADHKGYTKLKPHLSTSAGFLTDPGNLHLMETYRLIWQPTFQELARAGTPELPVFNPFRELENNRAHLKGEWRGRVYPTNLPSSKRAGCGG